ncbi:MAG: 3-hydroxyacyl-CoA dehydrogenase NAD-binding domain-containing protein [Dongiaceae bacterium]
MAAKGKYTIAVIGCGLIGASWAALFAKAGGDRVLAWDPDDDACRSFPQRFEKAVGQLRELGHTETGSVTLAASLSEAVGEADWIQENAPESIDIKSALYSEIEQAASPRAILASSTSSLLWSDLARSLTRPDRFLLAHPFNPPHLVPLVELYAPDAALLDRADAFYRRLDRVPVRLKREVPGHIAGRLASALWREAVSIVAEGVADVAEVDRALVHGPGLRWSVVGAHMGYHLGGGAGGIEHYLKHLGPSQERRWSTLGTPRLSPDTCDKLIAGITAEAAGRSVEDLEAERDRQLMAILKRRDRL